MMKEIIVDPLIETVKFHNEFGVRTCTVILNYETPHICVITAAQGDMSRKNMRQLMEYLNSNGVFKVKMWRINGHKAPYAEVEYEYITQEEVPFACWTIDISKYINRNKRDTAHVQ